MLLMIFFAAAFGMRTDVWRGFESREAPLHCEVFCELDGESYYYELSYDRLGRIETAGGDAYIADKVKTEQFSDAKMLLEQLEDYFTERGGSLEVKGAKPK